MNDAPVIGLLNNMPDRALRATETQFRTLLQYAIPGVTPKLVLLALPGLERSGLAAEWVQTSYRDAAQLDQLGLDGLIVTGMEPSMAALDAEPCWRSLATVIDTAWRRHLPTVFSCLGAHAAILYLDGIQRQRLPKKFSGLMHVSRAATGHAYATGLPQSWITPHSRWNGLNESELRRAGYEILSSTGSEVDAFASRMAPFLFLQGHPEYDRSALMHEYIRDVRRSLTDKAVSYPEMPQWYFDAATEKALLKVRAAAHGGDRDELFSIFGRIMRRAMPAQHCRPQNTTLLGNWLACVPMLAAQKQAVQA